LPKGISGFWSWHKDRFNEGLFLKLQYRNELQILVFVPADIILFFPFRIGSDFG